MKAESKDEVFAHFAATWRAFQIKQEYQRYCAAVRIQAIWRGCVGRRLAQKVKAGRALVYTRAHTSDLYIFPFSQAAIHGFLVRQYVDDVRAAAITLQCQIRAFLVRCAMATLAKGMHTRTFKQQNHFVFVFITNIIVSLLIISFIIFV